MGVQQHSANDIIWPFRDDPYILCGETRCTVDPTPAYPHDSRIVTEVLHDMSQWWPLQIPVTYHILEREELGRTNGSTSASHKYEQGTERKNSQLRAANIILSGKRIPPHPAVTRYVTAHEYGHAVQYAIADRLDISYSELVGQYAALRGIDNDDDTYGAGLWDLDAGEVMACDIRLLAAVEMEYWPHRHTQHPSNEADEFLDEHRNLSINEVTNG